MPVQLSELRSALLPGLMAQRYAFSPSQWTQVFAAEGTTGSPPALVSIAPATAIAVGAAAAVIRNPIVTRRFWQWWK